MRRQALFKRVFGSGSHLEWADVRKYLADVSHSTDEWMQLFALLDFSEEPPLRVEVQDLLRFGS